MLKLLSILLVGQVSGVDGGVANVVAQFDAPVTFTDPIYKSCSDAPPVIEVSNPDGGSDQMPDGGVAAKWLLLPPERAARHACILASCETNRAQEANANYALISVVGAAGVLIGAAIGAGIAVAVKK